MKVIIKETNREYDGFFKVDRTVLQHEKHDGSMSKEIARLNFNRGDAVAVLLYNKVKKLLFWSSNSAIPHTWTMAPAG